jgi:hypothetical protein
MRANTTGQFNTAVGTTALENNTTGQNNTAVGMSSMRSNTTGAHNVAIGDNALAVNSTGFQNVAIGNQAMFRNTMGFDNVAIGMGALGDLNANAFENTAIGRNAMRASTSGLRNTGIGAVALYNNSTGSDNTTLGNRAGLNLTTGSYNIMIGSNVAGNPGEDRTIRLGNQGLQTKTYVAGIYGATSSAGVAVYVNSSGQLGTATSSERYKEDIASIDDATTSALMQLRPVSFHYKPGIDDGSRTTQFGLIAEEVAKVMPELVARNQDGSIETVRYQFLTPMLLSEVQQQKRTIDAQSAEIAELRRQMAELAQAIGAKSGN